MFISVWSGPGKSVPINRLIQLSVIQLSGGPWITVNVITLLRVICYPVALNLIYFKPMDLW